MADPGVAHGVRGGDRGRAPSTSNIQVRVLGPHGGGLGARGFRLKRAGLQGGKTLEIAHHFPRSWRFFHRRICSGTTEGDLRLGVISSYSSSRADVLDCQCPGARWGVVPGLFLRVVLHHHAADGRAAAERRADLSKGGAVHVAISRIFGLGYASGVGVWRITGRSKQRDRKHPKKNIAKLK